MRTFMGMIAASSLVFVMIGCAHAPPGDRALSTRRTSRAPEPAQHGAFDEKAAGEPPLPAAAPGQPPVTSTTHGEPPTPR
jgi:hypothetical protein